jgi:hypothetical protein
MRPDPLLNCMRCGMSARPGPAALDAFSSPLPVCQAMAGRSDQTLGVMKLLILILAALLGAQVVVADGLPLKSGRYPGRVVDLKLTEQQKKVIEHYQTCQLERSDTMNIYTPYVFTLTSSQAAEVIKKMGYAPKRLQVYETMRGVNDSGPHWNLALRYSKDRIEIPLKLLLREKEAFAAHQEQGWRDETPCFPELSKQ